MNLIVIGPQGSGKGEQAALLAKELNLVHINTGDIFREIAKEDSQRGRIVQELINVKGKLLPDEFAFKVLKEVLEEKPIRKGFVFDGYPRSFAQLKKFEPYLRQKGERLDRVFYLDISPETSVKRLSSRRVCEKCQEVYNLLTDPPQRQGVCDRCQGKLVRRADDEPEVIKKRLEQYREQTMPMVDYFEKQGILEKIDGEPPIKVVFEAIKKRLAKDK